MELHVADMHTAGEPVRIATGGYPVLKGATVLDKRREAREQHDLSAAPCFEGRGQAGMDVEQALKLAR
jgi:trans-L-3-hydroxyproline dehydratase